MTGLFERYPASAEAIRGAARSSTSSVDSLNAVQQRVEAGHRKVLQEAAGDLRTSFDPGFIGPVTVDIKKMQRAALWATCKLEEFADAIDTYNDTSTSPRSIKLLNQEWARATVGGKPRPELKAQLQQEKQQLDAWLDGVENRLAAAMNRLPSDAEVRDAWRAGNLPVQAAPAWRHLNLRLSDIPYQTGDVSISEGALQYMNNAQLASELMNPALNPDIRQYILDHRQSAVDTLGEKWELTTDTEVMPDIMCAPNSDGQIVGPDGRLYYVEQPKGDPTNGDYIPDDGAGSDWRTVDSREGQIAYGRPIDTSTTIAYILAGTAGLGKPVGDWQSIGAEQQSYIDTQNGHASLGDGRQPQSEPSHPPYGPVPDRHTPSNPHNGGDRAYGAIWVAVGGLEGANNAQIAEFNRHYASEVTFQENADGDRRAVINLYQAVSDGNDVRIDQTYGTIDDWRVVPQ